MAYGQKNYADIQGINGKEFLIDAEDVERISQYSWTVTPEGYVKTYLEKSRLDPTYAGKRERRVVYLHRLVMDAAEDQIIDHISRDKTDNRKANLRPATKSLNALNSKKTKSSTGYRGVLRDKQKGKPYSARITVNGKQIHLGRFNTAKEASKAYLTKQEELIK